LIWKSVIFCWEKGGGGGGVERMRLFRAKCKILNIGLKLMVFEVPA